MAKKLILITAGFPYDDAETFLETEIEYLSSEFDEVFILSNSLMQKKVRETPANCIVKRLPNYNSKIHKLKSLISLFSIYFWKEEKCS